MLLKQNIALLSQAEGTLFTTHMMIDLIGKDDCTPGADTILNEWYIPPEGKLSPLQIAYFKNLQCKNRKEPEGIPTMINVDHIKQGFKQWKEYTSAPPSNRHLGYYTSLLIIDGKHKKEDNEEISNAIWSIIVTMINSNLLTLNPLTRWNKVVPIMIEKEKANSKINRLRIIDKYEADYNLILKLY